jgi:hypothetical protein
VPLGTCVILSKITTKPLEEIIYQNASGVAILLVVGLTAWRVRALNVGGSLVLALCTYGCWSLGSEWWAAPVLAGFAIYTVGCITMPRGGALRVSVVFRAVLPSLLLLVINNMFRLGYVLYAPFLASLAAVLGLSLRNHALARRTAPPVTGADAIWPAGHMGLTALAALVVLALQQAGVIHPLTPPAP